MPTECVLPQLDLFEERRVQFSVDRTDQIELKPLASIENARVIQFAFKGIGEEYKNLSSIYLKLKVKMIHLDKDGKLEATQPASLNVYPVNNILHSLFRQVTLTLNGQQIAQNNANYAYRAYFEHLLNFEQDIGHQVI